MNQSERIAVLKRRKLDRQKLSSLLIFTWEGDYWVQRIVSRKPERTPAEFAKISHGVNASISIALTEGRDYGYRPSHNNRLHPEVA